MPYRIEHTTIVDKYEQLKPLFALHREESLKRFPELGIEPNMPVYEVLEAQNALLAVLVYAEAEIVGYTVSFLTPHINHKSWFYAHNNLIFLHPEHRAGALGLRLIRETERYAEACGAMQIVWQAQRGTPFEKLLSKQPRRYTEFDLTFGRKLGAHAQCPRRL